MTLTQYKKVIKSLTRDELEAHLFEMFKSSKVFKDCPLPAKIDRKKVKKTE